MKWSIGMPSYNNLTEVYFTVQSFRMYHANLKDYEIIVVDNFGDIELEKYIKNSGGDVVRYEKYTDITGVSAAKNRLFEVAKGEFVLCMDSHILIAPGAFNRDPCDDDLIQGPMMRGNCHEYWTHWLPQWRGKMWGIWGPIVETLPKDPFEIWAMGAGFFATRRDTWLGFNKKFRGFGGESGYIQEKYRKAGRKVWCYPNLVWQHHFSNLGRGIPYPLRLLDRVRNYIIGFEEIGLDTKDIRKEFGESLFIKAKASISNEA